MQSGKTRHMVKMEFEFLVPSKSFNLFFPELLKLLPYNTYIKTYELLMLENKIRKTYEFLD